MLTIGIVDVTTVGSTLCQRRLSELGGLTGNHPEFAVHSIPFIQYRQAIINADWNTVAQLVQLSINKLVQLGVDFIIIPSNTPHYAYEKYAVQSPVPILNLIEMTAETCEKAALKHVAVLGTKATMTGGLYQAAIEKRGMVLVVPPPSICQAIDHFILEEIVPDQVRETTRQQVRELIQTVACDGFILGCTELSEVYSTVELGKPAIDTTRLLAEQAFEIAVQEDKKRRTL